MAKLTISETFARRIMLYLRKGVQQSRTTGYLTDAEAEESLEIVHTLERRLDKLDERLRAKGARE